MGLNEHTPEETTTEDLLQDLNAASTWPTLEELEASINEDNRTLQAKGIAYLAARCAYMSVKYPMGPDFSHTGDLARLTINTAMGWSDFDRHNYDATLVHETAGRILAGQSFYYSQLGAHRIYRNAA